MFSLIITIISIALVTALALATIDFGKATFRHGWKEHWPRKCRKHSFA